MVLYSPRSINPEQQLDQSKTASFQMPSDSSPSGDPISSRYMFPDAENVVK
jgi:hypothetical protein